MNISKTIRSVRPADAVWSAIAVAAAVHNTWAAVRRREQLSDAMDRYRAATPWVEVGIWVVAAHLTRRIPAKVDPLAGLYIGVGAIVRRRWLARIALVYIVVQVFVYVLLCRAGES